MGLIFNVNVKEEQRNVSVLSATIAGALAGFGSSCLIYPLDTVKTRTQAKDGFIKAGGYRRLYKGFVTLAIGALPINSIFFGSYEAAKQFLEPKVSPQHLPMVYLCSATVCRGLTSVIRIPVEVAKQRSQTSISKNKNAFTIWAEAYRIEGFRRGLYRGFAPTLLRDLPFSFVQMPIWEFLRTSLKNYTKSRITSFQSAVCGLLAGGVAGALTTPLDVAKTRIMLADAKGISYDKLRVKVVLMNIYRESGVKGLYTGVVPRTVIIMIGGFIFFGVYEEIKFAIDDYLRNMAKIKKV